MTQATFRSLVTGRVPLDAGMRITSQALSPRVIHLLRFALFICATAGPSRLGWPVPSQLIHVPADVVRFVAAFARTRGRRTRVLANAATRHDHPERVSEYLAYPAATSTSLRLRRRHR